MNATILIIIVVTVVIFFALLKLIHNEPNKNKSEYTKMLEYHRELLGRYYRLLNKEVELYKEGKDIDSRLKTEEKELEKKIEILGNQIKLMEINRRFSLPSGVQPLNDLDKFDYDYLSTLEKQQQEQLRLINEDFQQQSILNHNEFQNNMVNTMRDFEYQNQLFSNQVNDQMIQDQNHFDNNFPPIWLILERTNIIEESYWYKIASNDINKYDIEEANNNEENQPNISSDGDFDLIGDWYCLRGSDLEETTTFKENGVIVHQDDTNSIWLLNEVEDYIYMYYPDLQWGGNYQIVKHNDYYIIQLTDITFVRPENYDDYKSGK